MEDDDFFNLDSTNQDPTKNFEVKIEIQEEPVQSNIKTKRKRRKGETKSLKSDKNILNDSDTAESRKTKNPSLVCEICGKFLIGSGSLKKHMMSHLGVNDKLIFSSINFKTFNFYRSRTLR